MSLTFQRHYKLLVILALVVAVLVVGLGDQRIVAYTLQGNDYSSDVTLLYGKVVHTIQGLP
ncbi:MAG: hypothetical protein FJZ89_00025 [Chloroflexi bacterium]|nr:hypothetical protein [Chloroflexota bacterium]